MVRCLRLVALAATTLLVAVSFASAAATANRPPKFLPGPVTVTWNNDYDIVSGAPAIVAQTAKIKLARGAKDPDGDRVRYRWTASNGKIRGSGLRATWVRVVSGPDQIRSGDVTVVALDGKGGKAVRKLVFR